MNNFNSESLHLAYSWFLTCLAFVQIIFIKIYTELLMPWISYTFSFGALPKQAYPAILK